ncbi:MAG: hypothetical protein MJZ94_08770 [Bacteroidales bacterium]|nr:hypothetical protein [Bacteroidales bacterium]
MARNEAIQTFTSLHRSFSLERKVTKSSRGKIMASALSAYRLDFQASCHKRRYMKIKPIVSPLGGRCSDFSPFLTRPARTHFVNPVPASSFFSGKCPKTSGKAATLAEFAQFAVMHPRPAGITPASRHGEERSHPDTRLVPFVLIRKEPKEVTKSEFFRSLDSL